MYKPKYKKIIDDIISKLNDETFERGMKLPSQREMANYYDVNRSTIIQALDILQSYGIIEGKERSGLYLSDNKWNTYINSNTNWQKYISNSSSKNNQYFIQMINKLEFESDLIRLSTGELRPDLIPNEKFKEILSTSNKDLLNTNYEHPQGSLKLRQAISNHVKKSGIICNEDNICITSGALQGLKLIADGLLVPQSKIIIETPSYINSIRTWHNIRADIKHMPIFKIKRNINNIFNAESEYNNSIFYCIPTLHNPTTNSYTIDEKQKLITQCKKAGIPIVEDDVYGDLYFDDKRPLPLKSFEDNDNILYLNSLSKTVSPGLRIGWIIGKPSVVQHLADLKMQNDYGASSLSQYVATEWLNLPSYHERHLKKLKQQLLKNRDAFLHSLEKHLSHLGTWTTPKGSFYIWFKLNVSIDMKILFDEAIKHKLLINPGEIYDTKSKNYIRFSYSYIDIKDIDKALKKLSDLIQYHTSTSVN